MEVYKNLKECRTAAGLTQEQAAEKLCVTRQTISSYERGRTQADLDTLHRLAEIYGVTVERLLYGEETAQKTHHLEKAALAVFIGYFLWLAVSFGMMWWLNNFLQIPGARPGHSVTITEDLVPLTKIRFAFRDKADAVFRIGAMTFKTALLVLTCWDVALGSQGTVKKRMKALGVFLAGTLGLVIFWGAVDPVYRIETYLWQILLASVPTAVFYFSIDIIFAIRQSKKRKNVIG